MNLREFFTPAVLAANWAEVASNMIDYIGPSLFPARKKAGLDLSWIKGSKGLPVSLMPSTFDAKATFRDRIGFEKLETEMPFFREGFLIKEKDRQELLRVMDSNDPYAQDAINRIFDDSNNLIAGAAVVPERMIWQLLLTGKIEIKANGVDYSYNYDSDGTWAGTNVITLSEDGWDKPQAANPFKNFNDAKKKVRSARGTILTTAIMNSTTFELMAATDAVKNRYLTTSNKPMSFLTDEEVANVVQDTSKINIAVYDKMYADEDKKPHLFVPDGYVAMIPDGALGNTWKGTTPEEADLQGETDAEVEIVDGGTAITRIVHKHPVNIEILASEIVLPSFERMDDVVVLKVSGE